MSSRCRNILYERRRPVCKSCEYYGLTTNSCDCYLITGHRRGTTPTDKHCDKYRKGKGIIRSKSL